MPTSSGNGNVKSQLDMLAIGCRKDTLASILHRRRSGTLACHPAYPVLRLASAWSWHQISVGVLES